MDRSEDPEGQTSNAKLDCGVAPESAVDVIMTSKILSDEEVRFFIKLVFQWFSIMRDPSQPVRTCADLERSLRSASDPNGSRYQFWAMQMQCKFGEPCDSATLRKKWDNLMRTFKKVLEREAREAVAKDSSSADVKTKFKFYFDMKQFFVPPEITTRSRASPPEIVGDGSRKTGPGNSPRNSTRVAQLQCPATTSSVEAVMLGSDDHISRERSKLRKRTAASIDRLNEAEQLYLTSIAEKMLKSLEPSVKFEWLKSLNVDHTWVRLMQSKFEKEFSLSQLRSEWESLLISYAKHMEEAFRVPRSKLPGRIPADVVSKAIDRLISDLPSSDLPELSGDRAVAERSCPSSSKVLKGGKSDESSALGELVAVFQDEAREDRKLMRKMLAMFSRVCDSPLEPDSEGTG